MLLREKVFSPVFFKKLVGCGRTAHDLDLFLQDETAKAVCKAYHDKKRRIFYGTIK